MDRRRFLVTATAIGGGGAAIGAAGAGWRAHEAGLIYQDPAPFAPWFSLGQYGPGEREGLCAAAILASNPHNTQPWRVGLSDAALVVEADEARHLGAFDPFRREMWIGLGGAFGAAEVAAPGLGLALAEPQIAWSGAAGAGRIEASIARAAVAPHSLATALAERRTNRAPYDPAPVAPDQIERVLALTGPVAGARVVLTGRETEAGRRLAAMTLEATEAINADAQMSRDGHVWFRNTAREVAEHRDGVSVATAGLSPVMTALGQMLPPVDAATSGRYWLASTKEQLAGAGGFGWILVDDLDDRAGQIAAGRLWQRLHLAFTAEGLAAQPLNQVPEMADRDRQLGRDGPWGKRVAELAGGEGRLTFAFRFGRPLKAVPHAARRPLEWVDLKGA